MRDLIQDELQQADRLKQKHLDGFLRDGMDLLDLARSGIRHDWVIHDGYRFEFARHSRGGVARSAFIFPAWDSFGNLADLIAWRPGREIATWLGNVGAIGEEQVLGPRLGEPLRIHSSVAGWFRAKRCGLYILDYGRMADLLRCETLGAEDLAHARLLKTRLTIAAPPIVVMEESAQRAPVSQVESEVA